MVSFHRHARCWGAYVVVGVMVLGVLVIACIRSPSPLVCNESGGAGKNPNQYYQDASCESADAARQQAYWAEISALGTLAGIALLVGTLVYTARTAKASAASADAAERALTELERPWIWFEKATILGPTVPQPPGRVSDWVVALDFKNIGRSPALIRTFEFDFVDETLVEPSPPYARCRQVGITPQLAHGEKCKSQRVGLGGKPTQNLDGTAIQYIFFGRIIYTDMAGRECHSGFAYRVYPDIHRCGIYSKDAYSYYK